MKISQTANDNSKEQLIGRTCQLWQSRTGLELSCEDARQIAENVAGFFTILVEWSRAETTLSANDNGKSNAPGEVRHDR